MVQAAQRKSMMQAFLGTVLVVGFLAMNGGFLWFLRDAIAQGKDLPAIVTASFMAVINFCGVAVGFYLGSSKGSQDKTDALTAEYTTLPPAARGDSEGGET